MKRSGILRVRPVRVDRLSTGVVDALWRLYETHYDQVARETFERDLAEKQLVFLGTDSATGAVVGFSTALFYSHPHDGRRVGIYFSGDTIVLPAYWGQSALHRAVVGTLMRWKLRHPSTPLYWYLLCSGYRTYLTLVRNFPEHWPRYDRATPEWEAGLLDSIGRARYGDAWKPERGVISLDGPQPVLKSWVAPFDDSVLRLPEVRFFVSANPGFAEGDELALIARASLPAAVTMTVKWMRRARRGTRRVQRPSVSDVPSLVR